MHTANIASGEFLSGVNETAASLTESENRYRQLVHGLSAAIYICNREGKITLYNKAAAELWGREPELGKDMWCGSWRIYYPDGTPMPLDSCPMAIALTEGRGLRGAEIIIERPDGTRRNVLPHPEPIFDRSGNVIEAVNMLVDVSGLKRFERVLRESEERFRALAAQAPIIIWMFDENGNAIYLNEKWSEYTGYAVEEGYGMGWSAFIHNGDRDEVISSWEDAFRRRAPFNAKFRYRDSGGGYRIVSINCTIRVNEQGDFMGYIGVIYDVTLQENSMALLEKLVEDRTRDLREANIKLERSNYELEQYAYVASHDLQEPLRKIRMFADRMYNRYNGLLDDEARLNLDKIADSAKRMTELINDLLNFSRLTRQGESFVETSLNDILDKVSEDFELLIDQKKAVIIADPLPVIEAIPLQINQLFHNLLSNSLKFSTADVPPVISISARELSPSEVAASANLDPAVKYWEIIFKDNGIGFNQEYASQIFIIFKRLGKPGEHEGSGIGLALCRKVVNNHHGIIQAYSNEKEGASFHIVLPEKQPEKNIG